MQLTADFHTHTKFSHGKGKVIDNAIAAKVKGLSAIGITDHGFSHPAFGLNPFKVKPLIRDCKLATEQTGVKVLVGLESNLTSIKGDVDLKPKRYDDFDLFLVGIHKAVWFKLGSWFPLGLPNTVLSTFKAKKVSDRIYRNTTNALVQAIKKNPIDIITHLNYSCYLDPVEVAKVAADYGTYIELNSKKVHLTDEQLYNVCKTGVRFVINSDAHSPDRVADISLVEEMLKRVDVPLDRIDNIDGRYPNFRFTAFKEKSL